MIDKWVGIECDLDLSCCKFSNLPNFNSNNSLKTAHVISTSERPHKAISKHLCQDGCASG